MASLSLRGIVKRFGAATVVCGADLEVADGELVVFVGPSGCGKSTLLRMIAGLESITEGELRIGGKRMNEVGPGDRGAAMVFQSYALYPHMTARENIGFGLRMAAKLPKDEIARRVEKAASALHLEGLLERKPKELSGGQRQRVAIGRAMVREPDVFLLDEPLSNLDAELRARMRVEIRRLHRGLGATMIHVTHDQVEAMTLADRIVVLNAGRIEQAGEPMELYRRPRNIFVAGFIGSPKMNFFPAKAESVADGRAVLRMTSAEGAALSLPLSEWNIAAGDELTVGARPDILAESRPDGGDGIGTNGNGVVSGGNGVGVGGAGVGTDGDGVGMDGDGSARFSLEVEAAERLGGSTCHYCRATDGKTVLAESPGDATVSPGGKLRMRLSPSDAHVFGANGETRRREGAE